MAHIQSHEFCRVCGGSLEDVLSLGNVAPSDFTTGDEAPKALPLTLTICDQCGLVQLRHTLDLDLSFRSYWYKSGLNRTMVAALRDIVQCALPYVDLSLGDVSLDIGCNDGTLLSLLPGRVRRVGFEPALNLADDADRHADVLISDYFTADKYPHEIGPAKLITTIAMFYDLDDPKAFVRDIVRCLHPDGVWVIQMMDLDSMLAQVAFDNICFEHLIYYRLSDLRTLLESFGLEIFHASHNMTNGGSVRAMVCHAGRHPVSQFAPVTLLADDPMKNVRGFAGSVGQIKTTVVQFITEQVQAGKSIYVMGASTKGNTLLQYFGLDSRMIEKAAEVSRDKIGKKTVATGIPIASEAECLADQPDYFLVLPWHFINDFVARNQDYLDRGGRFIVPLPRPAVIGKDGWTFL